MLLLLAVFALSGCKGEEYTQLYDTEDKAPSLDWADIAAMDHMGPVIIDQGVNFCVWSERATRIDLLLFDDPESELPVQQFPLTRTGDLWTLYVEGIGLGQHYGFIAWGPNWIEDPEWLPGQIDGFLADVDEDGNRFDPNKLLFDPWGKAPTSCSSTPGAGRCTATTTGPRAPPLPAPLAPSPPGPLAPRASSSTWTPTRGPWASPYGARCARTPTPRGTAGTT